MTATPLDAWMPLLILFSSFFTGLFIFALNEEQGRLRSTLNMIGAIIKVALVAWVCWGVLIDGRLYEIRLPVVPEMDLVFRIDLISLLFSTLSAVLWLVTTIYAIGYLEHSPHRSRFFGFFSLSVTAAMGVALAGNLLTFFIFYELLTLATYPLVVHRGTREALAAGRTYLFYTLTGGALFLLGVVWLHLIAGPVEFRLGGGVPAGLVEHHRETLQAIFVLMMAGLGVKAAIVPLHGWLPQAMIAPAPVSALLHAVAVVKAGAYGIVRMVYDLFGIELAHELGLLTVLMVVASVTIIYGSLRALAQVELKKRLAYSTVSQLSYIVLGASIFGPIGTVGGLVHLVHQGLMKITLFFCAGNYAETLGVSRVDELDGVGRQMPLTTAAMTVAGLGMIGIPPVAGFVSKWYLGLGGLEAGYGWVVVVLVISSLLNALYFLPLMGRAWFGRRAGPWPEDPHGRKDPLDAMPLLLWPTVATAVLSLWAGLMAAWLWSPLALAELIAQEMYGL